jgi:hypothetical protein
VDFSGLQVGCSVHGGIAAFAGSGSGSEVTDADGTATAGESTTTETTTATAGKAVTEKSTWAGLRKGDAALCIPLRYAIRTVDAGGDNNDDAGGDNTDDAGGSATTRASGGNPHHHPGTDFARFFPEDSAKGGAPPRPNAVLAARLTAFALQRHRFPGDVFPVYTASLGHGSESRLVGMHPRSVRGMVLDVLRGGVGEVGASCGNCVFFFFFFFFFFN